MPPAEIGSAITARPTANPLLWKATRLAFQGLICLFLCGALFVTLFLPYRAWDALSYGEWSRLIAQTGDYHFPTATEHMYQRPLFYVAQGWLWRLLGYHDAIGRALGLSFGVLLAVAVWRLSRQICPDGLGLSPYISLALLIAIPGVTENICSGLTDVPVAALIGCAGSALWTLPAGVPSALLIALLSCLAVLAKPSALAALAGLALASLIGARKGLVRRLLLGCLPVVAGTCFGLLYDLRESRRLHTTLDRFLMSPVVGYYTKLTSGNRFKAFWDWNWLGPGLRFPLLLAASYAVLRISGLTHRRALRVSVPAALFLSWFGPWIAAGRESLRAGFLAPGRSNLVFLLAAVLLAGACLADEHDFTVTRVSLARLLAWTIPLSASWLLYAAYDVRLLSAAWAPMALLLCAVVAPPAVAGLRHRPWSGIFASVAIFLIAAVDLPSLDGLGPVNWTAAGSKVARGRIRPEDLRRALSPDFAQILDILRDRVRPGEKIFSPDGRLRFFFPGHVIQAYPASCQDLAAYQYFVLPKGAGVENFFLTQVGVPGTVAYWSQCQRPSLDLVAQTRDYAVFRIAAAP